MLSVFVMKDEKLNNSKSFKAFKGQAYLSQNPQRRVSVWLFSMVMIL